MSEAEMETKVESETQTTEEVVTPTEEVATQPAEPESKRVKEDGSETFIDAALKAAGMSDAEEGKLEEARKVLDEAFKALEKIKG